MKFTIKTRCYQRQVEQLVLGPAFVYAMVLHEHLYPKRTLWSDAYDIHMLLVPFE